MSNESDSSASVPNGGIEGRCLPRSGGKKGLAAANKGYFSSPVFPFDVSSNVRGLGGAPTAMWRAPEPGTAEFAEAQKERAQRLLDESLCVLLRRAGAETMRQRILEALQQRQVAQASEGDTTPSPSALWEVVIATVMGADTADSTATRAATADAQADWLISGGALTGDARGSRGCGVGERARRPLATASVGCNTIGRGEGEKDNLIDSLMRSKVNLEKKIEELRRELATARRHGSQRGVSAVQAAASGASSQPATPPQAGGGCATAEASVRSPPLPSQIVAQSPSDAPMLPPLACSPSSSSPVPCSTPTPKGTRASSSTTLGRAASTPLVAHVTSVSLTFGGQGEDATHTSPQSPTEPSSAPQRGGGVTREAASRRARRGRAGSGAGGGGGTHSAALVLRRLQQQTREIRCKLFAIRTGLKAFSFHEVFAQFAHHALPPVQNLVHTHNRLIDRCCSLEKLGLDMVSRLGVLPDADSTEGYLPEGTPLHAGSYSMMDDKHFRSWIGKLHDGFMAKSGKVQNLITTLLGEVQRTQENHVDIRRNFRTFEERCQLLEGLLVADECVMVAASVSDLAGGLPVQPTRKPEYVAHTKCIMELNEEVKVACAISGWVAKPAARVKVNMWRQRRSEMLHRLEQMLLVDLQHFVSGGQSKSQMRAKITAVRELSQCLSRLHLMPTARQSVPFAEVSGPHGGASAASWTVQAAQQQQQQQQQQQATSFSALQLHVKRVGATGDDDRGQRPSGHNPGRGGAPHAAHSSVPARSSALPPAHVLTSVVAVENGGQSSGNQSQGSHITVNGGMHNRSSGQRHSFSNGTPTRLPQV